MGWETACREMKLLELRIGLILCLRGLASDESLIPDLFLQFDSQEYKLMRSAWRLWHKMKSVHEQLFFNY